MKRPVLEDRWPVHPLIWVQCNSQSGSFGWWLGKKTWTNFLHHFSPLFLSFFFLNFFLFFSFLFSSLFIFISSLFFFLFFLFFFSSFFFRSSLLFFFFFSFRSSFCLFASAFFSFSTPFSLFLASCRNEPASRHQKLPSQVPRQK